MSSSRSYLANTIHDSSINSNVNRTDSRISSNLKNVSIDLKQDFEFLAPDSELKIAAEESVSQIFSWFLYFELEFWLFWAIFCNEKLELFRKMLESMNKMTNLYKYRNWTQI